MDVEELISSIVVAILGLAIVAVLVSKRANTANVIQATGSSLGGLIGAAVSPITGAAIPGTVRSPGPFSAIPGN